MRSKDFSWFTLIGFSNVCSITDREPRYRGHLFLYLSVCLNAASDTILYFNFNMKDTQLFAVNKVAKLLMSKYIDLFAGLRCTIYRSLSVST